MSNLLDKDLLLDPHPETVVYAVYAGKDWRLKLETLLSLVTKASIGLDRVDNTTDLEKPISRATQDALNHKAEINDVVAKIEFSQLLAALENYVTIEQLQAAVQVVQSAMENYSTTAEMNAAIAGAISPVTQSIQTFNETLAEQVSRLAILEQRDADDVSLSDLTAAIQEALQAADLAAGQRDNVIVDNINALSLTLQDLSDRLTLVGQTVTDHKHTVEQVVGLREYIDGIISIGPNDW